MRRQLAITLFLSSIGFLGCGDDGTHHLADAPPIDIDAPVVVDTDGDGVADALDNCPSDANANQVDTDHDNIGDSCDPDDDNDGILDAADNCSLVANPSQENADGDGDGDACDGDTDGDTILNGVDNCPLAANTQQENLDGDGEGDACDADDDNDTILDVNDNCATLANTTQDNHDTDILGDACDPDDDDDTILDDLDNCPIDANTAQDNTDTDTLGDACDPDDDNDGIIDTADNCPLVENTMQDNADGDALGDTCDPDDDNDGTIDTADNCPAVANGEQSDLDGDTIGDLCDDDDDGDTVLDTADNCPTTANPDQLDSDADGHGDLCDGVLNPTTEGIIVGGNITSVGIGNAGRIAGVPVTSRDLVLTTLPANAHIVRAYLYWVTIGAAHPTVTFGVGALTASITGVEVGQVPDTCWNIGPNFGYRADVTPAIAAGGNQTYTVSDMLSATSGADGQGISLIVVYSDPTDTRNNFVSIKDGVVYIGGATVTMDGFTVAAGFDKVTLTTLMADGQAAGDSLTFKGNELGGGDAFQGLSGGMWDNRIDDVTSFVVGGDTSFPVSVNSGGDCLAWPATGIVIEGVDDTAIARPVPKAVVKQPKRPVTVAPTGGRGTTAFKKR